MTSECLLVSPASLMMVNSQRPGRGNLVRSGRLNKVEFRGPVKFQLKFLFVGNPNLLCNGYLPLVQDFKYSEKAL
jgi:hypothetical protein